MEGRVDPLPAHETIPDWRNLSLRHRLAFLRDIACASRELAWARLRLDNTGPAKINQLNRDASRASSRRDFGSSHSQIARIAYIIPRVAARLPWRADCLVQALAAQRWLRRLGIATHIVIGTRRGDSGEFLAHAWLKMDDRIITGGDVSTYQVLLDPHANRP